jgi:hypothetical protein
MMPSLTERSSLLRGFAWTAGAALAISLFVSTGSTGCSPAPGDADAGTSDAGADAGPQPYVDAGPQQCVMNPQTYLELVNACTSDQPLRVAQHRLPQQLSDGGLPMLGAPPDPDAGPVETCASDSGM